MKSPTDYAAQAVTVTKVRAIMFEERIVGRRRKVTVDNRAREKERESLCRMSARYLTLTR